MRILDLNLLAFGPFTEQSLDFSADKEKISIVYGGNEAGKSSSLRAISAALFGIPTKSRDNFVHEYKEMRVGATLANVKPKKTFRFLRRKGNKSTILEPKTGNALPDDSLAPYVGNLDSDTFQAIYAIDYEELERGGQQMQELRGLVGESLFAAGLGSGNLSSVLASFDDDALELFGKSKRKTRLNASKKAYEEATKQKRDAAIPSSRWQSQAKELEHAREKRDEIVNQMDEIRHRQSRLQRIRNSLSLLVKRRQLQEEIDSMGDVAELPDTYSPNDRGKIQSDLDAASRVIGSIRNLLDGADGLQAKVAAISIPDGILQQASVIQNLQQRLGAHFKAVNDRDSKLKSRVAEAKVELRRAIDDVLPDLADDVDNMAAIRQRLVSSDEALVIQELGKDYTTVHRDVQDLTKGRDDLTSAIEEAQSLLEELPKANELGELTTAHRAAVAAGDISAQIERRRNELERLESDGATRLSRLGLWSGSLADLATAPVPPAETVDRFADEIVKIENQQSSLDREVSEQKAELQRIDDQIESLERTLGVDSDDQLTERRAYRLRIWQQIKRALLYRELDLPAAANLLGERLDTIEDAAERLAIRFEDEFRAVDEMSDRLRDNAKEAAQLTTVLTAKKRASEKLEQLHEKQRKIDEQKREADEQWNQRWQACGISPLTPREMRSWSQNYEALIQLRDRIETASSELKVAESNETRLTESLGQQLANVGFSTSTDCLSDLIQLASNRLEEQTTHKNERQRLENSLQRLNRELEENERSLGEANEKLTAWQSNWRESMQRLGLEEGASSTQANQRLHKLNEIAEHVKEIEDIQTRIHHIDEDIDAFNDSVEQLVCRLAPDLAELPSEQAAAELQSRLERAQRDEERLAGLNQQIESEKESLTLASEQESRLRDQLAYFHKLAGTSESEDLSDLEESWSTLVQRREALRELDERILELGAGMSIAEIESEAEGQDVDQLATELKRAGDELRDIQTERDTAVARVSELERACEIEDTTSVAAEADQRSLGILSRMQVDAARYVRLRIASTILRHQIERHRAENQDPILARASDFFSRITCDEFKELRTEYDESDQATIVGVRREEDELVPVDAMSGGTRDQLYLALRLGYLESRMGENPMPLVVDDILIEFDNDRAQATLEVLSELAEQTQVIFFTHHHHLVELALESIKDRCCVHHLDGKRKKKKPKKDGKKKRKP